MIPLEDNFCDVIGKAQRGLQLSDEALADRAGVSISELARAKSGHVDESVLHKLAQPLRLKATALAELALEKWRPDPIDLPGLACFNTQFGDMTVNAYVIWDAATKEAAVFDTGADATPVLQFAKSRELIVKLILLTHTHRDHVADLNRLKKEMGAPVFVGELDQFTDATPFAEGRVFKLGGLKIETRQTSGHARGGITYVVIGLSRPIAVVGDALFAGSMGGGLVSYEEALQTNRQKVFTLADETVLCPGHGPLTTVAEEKQHNPFYPEFH